MNKLSRKKGFSLVEVLSVMVIITVLTTIGVRIYTDRLEDAKVNNVKSVLATIYSSEQSFKRSWGTFHPNLVLIGATPTGGNIEYDVGFKTDASSTYPEVIKYPIPNLVKKQVHSCDNFYDICSGTTSACTTQSRTAINGTTFLPSTVRNSIKSSYDNLSKNCSFSDSFAAANSITSCSGCSNAQARKDNFTAVAIIRGSKIIINENKVMCEEDGSVPAFANSGCDDAIN